MVNLWLLGAIALFLGIGIFGSQEIKKANLQDRLPQNFSQDVANITKSFPFDDLRTFLFGGTKGLIYWFSQVTSVVAKWLIGLLRPGTTVPNYYGYVLLVLILVLFAWKTIGTFHEWGYEVLKFALILGGGIFVLFTVLIFLGVLK